MRPKRIEHDLYRGTLDIIVLSLIAEQSDHGYGIIERLKRQSEGSLDISEGAIYPLLHRLESKKLVSAHWGRTVHNRRAKQYQITETGRRVFADRTDQWRSLAIVIEELIGQARVKPSGGVT